MLFNVFRRVGIFVNMFLVRCIVVSSNLVELVVHIATFFRESLIEIYAQVILHQIVHHANTSLAVYPPFLCGHTFLATTF